MTNLDSKQSEKAEEKSNSKKSGTLEKTATWEKINYISTALIALIAIGGFIFSIKSSKETSEILEIVGKGINSFASPVIYLESYDWTVGNVVDCEHPPNGIVVRYKNGSNMPIKILHHYVSFGTLYNRNSKIDNMLTIRDTTETVLSNKNPLSLSWGFSREIQKLLINKRAGPIPPFIFVRFNGRISNLSESIIYDVQLSYFIQYDCDAIGVHSTEKLEDRYTLVSEY